MSLFGPYFGYKEHNLNIPQLIKSPLLHLAYHHVVELNVSFLHLDW